MFDRRLITATDFVWKDGVEIMPVSRLVSRHRDSGWKTRMKLESSWNEKQGLCQLPLFHIRTLYPGPHPQVSDEPAVETRSFENAQQILLWAAIELLGGFRAAETKDIRQHRSPSSGRSSLAASDVHFMFLSDYSWIFLALKTVFPLRKSRATGHACKNKFRTRM